MSTGDELPESYQLDVTLPQQPELDRWLPGWLLWVVWPLTEGAALRVEGLLEVWPCWSGPAAFATAWPREDRPWPQSRRRVVATRGGAQADLERDCDHYRSAWLLDLDGAPPASLTVTRTDTEVQIRIVLRREATSLTVHSHTLERWLTLLNASGFVFTGSSTVPERPWGPTNPNARRECSAALYYLCAFVGGLLPSISGKHPRPLTEIRRAWARFALPRAISLAQAAGVKEDFGMLSAREHLASLDPETGHLVRFSSPYLHDPGPH